MDILKREAAPISKEAWEEIDETAKDVLKNMLSARKVLKVNGPKGWDYNAVPEGRVEVLDKATKDSIVQTGHYEIQRLVEARVNFELSKWELDNIARGAEDPDLGPLEEAVEALAIFEEDAIYNGYQKGAIEGLIPAAGHTMKISEDPDQIITAIGEAKYAIMNAYVEMPYDIIVSETLYKRINVMHQGVYLMDVIKKITGGEIYRSKINGGGVMIPRRDEDLEFTVGQDFSIGYDSETPDTVKLFVTESFTLRVLEEDKIVHLEA